MPLPVCLLYSAVVYSVAFNRSIKVINLELLDKHGNVKGYKILFSTDLEMEAHRVHKIYKGRFQIEFLYLDAKQYAGLEHCQARSESKLHFQFNTSLTSVGIGKLIHQKLYNNTTTRPISIHDVAAELSNINFAERLFSKYGINLYFDKNQKAVQFIRNFAKRAA